MPLSNLDSPNLKVLIVEDDSMMQLGLEQVLSDYPQISIVGYAEDGYRAVQMVQQLRPDLVVMDIGLPRLDGIAATEQIKQAFPTTTVVILTSHTAETEILAALSVGADAYCVKGTNVEHLLAAIEAAQLGALYLDPQIARVVVNNLKPPARDTNVANLSQREMEILRLIVDGLSNTEIANKLHLSPNTIKTHVKGIMNKLAVDDRVQAAVIALRSGLV
ncbi:MAG: response regulator transcription factor [Cyanobacteria bacterium]|nr:response regulator transcription factor [Cyanobacteriota bacterium]MDW8202079.1 response regulator transcription factor [Cyanobacteriota bacterium SKYGB_h_bin112]